MQSLAHVDARRGLGHASLQSSRHTGVGSECRRESGSQSAGEGMAKSFQECGLFPLQGPATEGSIEGRESWTQGKGMTFGHKCRKSSQQSGSP